MVALAETIGAPCPQSFAIRSHRLRSPGTSVAVPGGSAVIDGGRASELRVRTPESISKQNQKQKKREKQNKKNHTK